MNIRFLFMAGVWLSCISFSRANIPSPHKFNQVASREPVKGTVVGADGAPIAGATVRSLSSKHTTTTNEKGEFTLQVAAGEKLVISFVGYKDQEVTVTDTSLQVTLAVGNSQLNEVVVVGYGSRTKADVTGALTQLKADNIRQGVNISVDNMLQGKVAGVRIAQSSGEPGAGVDVFIRGVGSVRSGSTPLFVVDGVPLSNDNVSAAGTDVGMGSTDAKNPLNFLNTSDIETITVLKDASAAAIYGARGSNGVVLITTKHGKKGDPSLTYDMYVGTSKVIKKLDLLSASEYRAVNPASDHGGNTDWQDAILRNGFVQNHNLSFSKTTATGSYLASLSHLDQNGIVKNSGFKRTTGRLNAEESFFDNKRLTIKMNLTASNIDETGIPNGSTAGSDGQVLMYALMANPTWNVYDSTGNFTNFKKVQIFNPLYVLSVYDDRTNTFRVLGNMEATLRLLPGLNYRLNVGIDKSTSARNTTMYPNLTDRSPKGIYTQNNLRSLTTLMEHYLTYNLAIQKHQVEVLGGFSYQKFNFAGTAFNVQNLAAQGAGVPPMYNPGYSGTPGAPGGYAQENELQSYFGRVNYNYDNRFLFTASVRADGSTRFGENNKYGYFPSFAAGWNLTREKFLENVSVINNLKLRASWGQTGNQEVPNKITQASYSLSAGSGYYLDGTNLVNGVTVNRTANPNLKWELVEQYNIGTDFELFKNKLYGSIEYYNKTTKDPILYIPSEPLSPTSMVWKNVGAEIINKGFEFTLGSQLISKKDLTWNVDVNGATLKNTVKDLPVSQLLSGSISGTGISNVSANIYKNGYAAGSFYMIKFLGYDKDGKEMFEDYKKDGVINADDRQIFKGAIPTFSYGLNSQVRYKTLDLAVAFIGQTGGYLFNNTALDLGINNLTTDRNSLKKYADAHANKDANVPSLSSEYLEKSDFLRLSNLRLGNTFTFKQIPWMQSINIYVSASNLFTITKYSGYDPLVNSTKNVDGNQSLGVDYTTYPAAKNFLVGATIKF
jgi:iron complex outermembrane receptor protein